MVKPILNTSALATAISVALALATPLFADSWSALGFGIVPSDGAQFPNIDDSVYGLNLSLLCGRNRNMFGMSIAVIGHYVDSEAAGIQISGAYSGARSASDGLLQVGFANQIENAGMGMQIGVGNLARDYIGLQVGAMNFTDYDFKGLQIGCSNQQNTYHSLSGNHYFTGAQIGAANELRGWFVGTQIGAFNIVHEGFLGIQIGALNGVLGEFTGSQIGAWNFVDDKMLGAQIGAVNAARQLSGVQIGGFNWAKKMHGAQIGAVNIIVEEFKGIAIGAINIFRNSDAMLLPVIRVSL